MLSGLAACGEKADISAKPEEKIISISESTLRRYIEESSGMWEFAQRFFDDLIIYKSKGGSWTYAAVDKDIPHSDYNWDNLRHAGALDATEWEYYEGTELRSIKGIDISQYNEVEDWDKVKGDGVSFAILRCGYRGYTKGGFAEDKKYIEYALAANKAGIELGTYFVTQAINTKEAIEEADWVIDMIKKTGVEFSWPVCLDLEDAGSSEARTAKLTKEERTQIIIAFCERIKEAGYTPMLYAAIRWYMDEMDITQLSSYDKWFAQYFNRPFFPYEFQIWQYTSSGSVNGIKGKVDLNLCFKDYSKTE